MGRKITQDDLREHLRQHFGGKRIIARHDPVLNEIIAAGTLANWDSSGCGVEERVRIGGKTFYHTDPLIERIVQASDAHDDETGGKS